MNHPQLEIVRPLDEETLRLFAAKGTQRAAGTGQIAPMRFNGNGLKVRRIMQIVRDLAKKPFSDLRILNM